MKNRDYIIKVLNSTGKFTNLSARKIKILNELIPNDETVNEHVLAQKIRVLRDKEKFEPIQIGLSASDFKEIIKEIRLKVKCRKEKLESVNLHFDSETIPLITIVENKF